MANRQGYWWETLTRDGSTVPVNVVERARWYEGAVRRERLLFYSLDGVIITLSAAIPVAVAAGASAAIAGVLGAVLTGLVALRQMLQPQQNWIRNTATLVAIQGDIVAWSSGVAPYTGDDADRDAAAL